MPNFIFLHGNAKSGSLRLGEHVSWAAAKQPGIRRLSRPAAKRVPRPLQNGVTLPDRALPHAPPGQAAVNATWRDPRGPYVVSTSPAGSFFYDLPPNDTRSSAYGLSTENRLGHPRWRLCGARNLLDKNYTCAVLFRDERRTFRTSYTCNWANRETGGTFHRAVLALTAGAYVFPPSKQFLQRYVKLTAAPKGSTRRMYEPLSKRPLHV